ncbi:Hcp family type VI secretion system effector [Paraburkholderia solisilvae]|uniref:Protein hcp1 n=1 Tax=Paraburkholderia solisilvae TaxID=624376 RepID=A0A6J5EYL4_9BURK|nr:type VI secretion system tube protein Hcp [Paraburkholderia solisilvae]CAB3770105.1 Protein hcp1 [Paraburkholderia solisilvae]
MPFDMHLKFGSGGVTITGDSVHQKHTNQIPILSWSWDITNRGDLHANATSGGKADVGDLRIVKYVDTASNAILEACCTGARSQNAYIYVTNTTKEPTDFLTVELSEGVIVTAVSNSANLGGDRLTETIWLHFGKFSYQYQPQDENGAPKGGIKQFAYDIKKAVKA